MQFMQTSWIQNETKNLISKVRQLAPIIHLHILMHTNASFNLSSMKVLIIVRVRFGFLSTLLHLHKIKDAHFSVIVFLPNRAFTSDFPHHNNLGPLWPTWSQAINTGLDSLVSQSLWRQSQITSFLLELLCPAFFYERLNNVEKY